MLNTQTIVQKTKIKTRQNGNGKPHLFAAKKISLDSLEFPTYEQVRQEIDKKSGRRPALSP